MNAVYYGYYEEGKISTKKFLTLFDNGTFVLVTVDAEYNVGTYTISGSKLVLNSRWSPMGGLTDITYEINSDYSQVIIGNVVLKRVNL